MKIRSAFIFFSLLAGLSIYYGFSDSIMMQPQGSHVWRQTDCASTALNYYSFGLNPFKPRMHNLLGGYGHTINELPVIYYTVALLYKLFGPHEMIFRLLTLLFFWVGLYYVYRLSLLMIKDQFWSMSVALLFYTVPLLLYYGNNFLPNLPGLSLALIAAYYGMAYMITTKKALLYVAMLVFLAAGLIKITALMLFVGMGVLFVGEQLKWLNRDPDKKWFLHPKESWALFTGVAILIAAWYITVKAYNTHHGSNYLLTGIAPVWIMSYDGFIYTTKRILFFWSEYFFFLPTIALTLVLFCLNIFLPRIGNVLISRLVLLGLIGSVVYSILWYYQYLDHDYYFINLYIWVVLVFINAVVMLQRRFPQLFYSKVFRIGIICFLLANVIYAEKAYWHKFDHYRHENPAPAFYDPGFKTYLKKLGIQHFDKVVSLPDNSLNITLYYIGQQGWTNYNMHPQVSAYRMEDMIDLGAKYLIINDPEYLDHEEIVPYLNKPLGAFKGIRIYDIHKPG